MFTCLGTFNSSPDLCNLQVVRSFLYDPKLHTIYPRVGKLLRLALVTTFCIIY